MHTEITEAGPFERLLTVHIDEHELEDAKNSAARKLSKELKIKGFRPGKAPRAVVERLVGAATLRSEAIDAALPKVVGNALEQTQLEPAVTPRLEGVRDVDGGAVELELKVTLWPAVTTVPDYAGRKITVDVPEVEDDEVERQLDRLRGQFAELEASDRPGDTGDFAMVSITALDGDRTLESASADDLLYEIGSRSFIPGLDEMLLGVSPGEIRQGPVTLPQGFGDAAGTEVTLRILVKDVRRKKLPEVTDEWVSDVSEFETVAELTEALRSNLLGLKVGYARAEFQDRLLSELTEELELDLPDALIDAEMEASFHNLAHRLEEQGIDLSNYLRITGQDQDGFVADIRQGAVRALRTRVLLEGVGAQAEIGVEPDEMEGAIASLAQRAGRSTEDLSAALNASGQDAVLSGDILRRKALERILDAAVAVDADGNPVDLTEPIGDDGDTEDEGAGWAVESDGAESVEKTASGTEEEEHDE
ncbi:MAG TPA: trigger factor [Acidimicrobiia bacterium]